MGEFPFYTLGNEGFIKETGAWVHAIQLVHYLNLEIYLNILLRARRRTIMILMRAQLVSESIESCYHSVIQCGPRFYDVRNKGLFMLHSNSRSLKKKKPF